MPPRTGKQHLGSLRTRYTLFAFLVAGLVLLGSSYAFLSLQETQAKAAQNLKVRDALAGSINGVRAALVEAYKSLDLFRMEPGLERHQTDLDTSLSEAIAHAEVLQKSRWAGLHSQRNSADTISERVVQLRGEIEELVAVRLDSARMYPSLAVGNDVMQRNRDLTDNSFDIAFYEMRMEETLTRHPDTYELFLRAQRLWMQMLSNFRLYLANRVGSFDESALPVQEQGITTMNGALQDMFDALDEMDAAGKVGFESGMALEDLRSGVDGWYAAFEEVRTIHRSDRWRMDAVMVKETIAPSIDAIHRDLLNIEEAFSQAIAHDIHAIAAAASRLAWTLWLVAGLAVMFVVVLLVTTDRLVLRPIAVVTRALKSEAMGKTGLDMPASRTQETRDLVEAFNEMHRQVRLRETELEFRALHDALTTLPNRTLLFERIEHGIRLARRDRQQLSLLMIDLDRFKEVNDTLGHQVGDLLLIEVGNRLRNGIRETDTVARLGGDEFAVLLPGASATEALSAVNKLLETFRKPVTLKGMEIYVAASVGVAFYPEHGVHADTLMQHADVAMYIAKRNQTGYALYDPDKDQYTISRLAMITDLRQAVELDQLELHYQPIVSLKTEAVIAVEALLRWKHPVHGQVSPELVIELAERTGLMGPLTEAVIDKALAQTARWRRQGITLSTSINLSMQNLHDGLLTEKVLSAMQTHGVPGESLTLEVTETAMMANPRQAMTALQELDDLGIRLAVDDFGTGFSSLAYLKSLPVDILKIDKSFVIGLESDKSDQAIVQATLSLGHNLGLSVVAEGVESAQVWDLLQAAGCDAAQGYHLCPPLPANEFEAWLRKWQDKRANSTVTG